MKIVVELGPATARYLERLVEIGIHGDRVEVVVERLVCSSVADLVSEDYLGKARAIRGLHDDCLTPIVQVEPTPEDAIPATVEEPEPEPPKLPADRTRRSTRALDERIVCQIGELVDAGELTIPAIAEAVGCSKASVARYRRKHLDAKAAAPKLVSRKVLVTATASGKVLEAKREIDPQAAVIEDGGQLFVHWSEPEEPAE